MSRPKGSKNKVKKQENYILPKRESKKRGRPKGSKNKLKNQENYILQPAEQEDQPKAKIEKQRRPKSNKNNFKKVSFFSPSQYIPYEKIKENKKGEVIKYQTYKSNGVWLIDIFTNNDLTLKGFDAGITKLGDAIQFIDSEIARL